MNASITNANLSNSSMSENGTRLVGTSPSQTRSVESDRPTGKRRESFLDTLLRALSAIAC